MVLGANAKARDRNGTTMLHSACRSGSFLMAQELLKRGLPLDASDSAGWTPVHVAAVMGRAGPRPQDRRELTLLLLQAQGNPHSHNKRGATPLDLCGDISTREALRTYAAKVPASTRSLTPLEDFQSLSRVQGEVGEDPSATCEPFFVPRQPIFDDQARELTCEVAEFGFGWGWWVLGAGLVEVSLGFRVGLGIVQGCFRLGSSFGLILGGLG
ncbi:unnamed protein product [Effrenium voratum]|nr:unnamed protein product [Effrenium voratum]